MKSKLRVKIPGLVKAQQSPCCRQCFMSLRDPELQSWVPDWRAFLCTNVLEHPGIYNINAGFRPYLEQLPKNHDFEITPDGAYLDNILESLDLNKLMQDLVAMPS